MKREKGFKSIRMKIVLYFVILFFVISLITGLVQYKLNGNGQFQNARNEVAKLASALLIDGDNHEKLVNKEDQSSDNYKEIRAKMIEFTEKTEVTGIYTLVEVGNDEIEIVIDGYDNPVDIGYEYQYLPEMAAAFEGNPSSAEDLRTDE